MERIQDRLQENSALTYYEDLGLSADASDAQIREAYLNLVRLLHPDLSSEPALKRFAANQMKRVSRAYAVLSDPERRRRYDAQLAGEEAEEPVSEKRRAGRSRARAWITLGWLICAFAGIVGIGWYVSQQTSRPSEPPQVSAAPNPLAAGANPPQSTTAASGATDKPVDLDSLRSELAAAKAERDRALEQTVLQAKELDFLTGRVLAGRPASASSRLSGVWVLPAKLAPASAFTPEAVDLIVSAQQDTLEGRFRARYPGMGIPEPPMVRFYFEGKFQDDVANATWVGEDGSKGEIQLKLASDSTLQLVWSTTQPGKQSGPDSGTLALVRKPGL